jgi:hypothetical protein
MLGVDVPELFVIPETLYEPFIASAYVRYRKFPAASNSFSRLLNSTISPMFNTRSGIANGVRFVPEKKK